MKNKVFSWFLFVCVMCTMALPVSATQHVYCKTDIIHTEYGDIEVETVLTVNTALTRSNYKSLNKAQTFKYDGKKIAEATLSATFGYDGKTSWVIDASGSHITYNGWTYSDEKITASGGTASLTAKLSHTSQRDIDVDISMTCSPTGQIS